MDPEEVRRLLQPYHSRLRSELERYGGTVEKFIGDAVMAVFGAPTAHEDDPERAVRAALAIRSALSQDGAPEIRVGVTTGEALIALDARPEMGEGIASGDVVNTASRLQAAAPTGGILVDETTYWATERAVEYGDAATVHPKGKAEPVRVWQALRVRSFGVDPAGGAPLVGRIRELTLLRETLARVKGECSPQLVTLVGVPGIGKSRLVFELSRDVAASPDPMYWRQGRSLPYGEGVTFWALGEIVKAHAGILESDRATQAQEKLRRVVVSVIGEHADAAWVERHLRALVGIESDGVGTGDRKAEAFAAWRRFLEALAAERPLVVVFEDLHWADEVFLDFVDHLVEWAIDVPMLVLATTRPELFAGRVGWGGGKVNSATLSLSPLSDEETDGLLTSLLGRAALESGGDHQELLARAGGNPLYAEEFVRMMTDRQGELTLPKSVEGIIAARLDALPREEKHLLQDAAVVGSVFWRGALGGEQGVTVDERLHSLARKEFVRRERESSVAGEPEYAFRHGLIREVAYEQIPKARRAEKHLASAEWIESLGRPDDHAEMLAHHYVTAFEYEEAAGQPTHELAERAVQALQTAGGRALSLNAYAAAARFYERALAMFAVADDERRRCDVLLALGEAQARAGDTPAANVTYRDAAALAETLRLPEQLALAALGYGGRLLLNVSRDDEHLLRLLESALAALEEKDSVPRVKLLARLAGGPLRDARFPLERKASVSREALEMARRIGDPDTLAYAIDSYIPANESPENTQELLDLSTELLEIATELGDKERALEAHEHRANRLVELGKIAEARADVDAMTKLAEELRQPGHDWLAAVHRARLALLAGRFADAEGLIVDALNLGTRAQSWNAGVSFNVQLYLLRSEQGRLGEVELLIRRSTEEYPTYPVFRCALALMTAELGRADESRELFAALAKNNFAELPFDDVWLVSLSFLAETASHLGDAKEAGILYELLRPYADRVAVSYTEIGTGSVSRSLGVLASTMGRWDDAAVHFEDALRINEEIGAWPWLVHTQYDYGRMLLVRNQAGDGEKANELLAAATTLCDQLGMRAVSENITALLGSASPVT
jgi:tetratricopeptide (TPR) repeat protein